MVDKWEIISSSGKSNIAFIFSSYYFVAKYSRNKWKLYIKVNQWSTSELRNKDTYWHVMVMLFIDSQCYQLGLWLIEPKITVDSLLIITGFDFHIVLTVILNFIHSIINCNQLEIYIWPSLFWLELKAKWKQH
jgi:hypothetical protein